MKLIISTKRKLDKDGKPSLDLSLSLSQLSGTTNLQTFFYPHYIREWVRRKMGQEAGPIINKRMKVIVIRAK
jgi:hypothetical protein